VNFKNKFEKIVNEWENKSTKQINVDEKKFDKVKKSKKYKDYTKNLKDDTYKKGKVRKFNYTTVKDQAKVQTQETKIKELYQQKSTESGKTSFLNTYKFN
jgi:hypothetical protein